MLERDSTNQQPDPYARHSGPPSGGQFTNYAYVPDSQPSSSHSEAQRRWENEEKMLLSFSTRFVVVVASLLLLFFFTLRDVLIMIEF